MVTFEEGPATVAAGNDVSVTFPKTTSKPSPQLPTALQCVSKALHMAGYRSRPTSVKLQCALVLTVFARERAKGLRGFT